LYDLRNIIESIEMNEDVDMYILFDRMIRFEIIYNGLRPNKIEHNDPYHGTVNKIVELDREQLKVKVIPAGFHGDCC
jgi:hypothetical protein